MTLVRMTGVNNNSLRLSWRNYEETVTSAFKKYLSSKWFCNVLLSAEGKTIPCHQELLSASSDWFEQVLSQLDTNLHPIILLKDVKHSDLQYLVDFIYNGQAVVPQDQVQGILNTASILQIKGLSDIHTEKTNTSEEKIDSRNEESTTNTNNSSLFFKNEELTVTTRKKSDAKSLEDYKIARKSSPTTASPCSPEVPVQKHIPNVTTSETPKAKKRRMYENTAPVYDNRQIYAADLLQTQLDYSGDDVVMPDEEENYEMNGDVCPASGVENCGSFKKIWSHTYLCYNLGKEILCLLCFCRFTQFKKFNLERHMRRKHADYYQLSQQVKKKVLDELVGRYEDLVTPGLVASVPSQGNQLMVTDILQLESIEWSTIMSGEEEEEEEERSPPEPNHTLPTTGCWQTRQCDETEAETESSSLLECQVKLQCEDVEHGFI